MSGHVVPVTAPAAVSSDEFVVIGEMFGIAQHSAETGETVQLGIGGVWRIPGLTGAQGDPVFHDGADLTMADGGGANTRAGVMIGAGLVRLNGSF